MQKAKPSNVYFLTLIAIIVVFVAGCAKPSGPVEQPGSDDQKAREAIISQLNANADISAITWSPDEAAILYIMKGKPEKAGFNEVYLRKVSHEQAQLVGDVSPGFLKFTWSPNSAWFLISETPGEGVSNRIFDAAAIKEVHKIASLDVPVWSPDSMFIAYGFEQHDYGESWGSLQVYKLGDP